MSGCPRQADRQAAETAGPTVVASIPPVAMILREVGAGCLTVHTLLPPGATPHAYEPRPSAARQVHEALALFYVSDDMDGWAAKLEAQNRVALIDLLPAASLLPLVDGHSHAHEQGDHGHGGTDSHFWTDPLTVRELLPGLVAELAKLDPRHAGQYRANAERFAGELAALDEQVTGLLEEHRGQALLMQHPSLQYFAQRYGLELAGLIEAAPGKEPSPAHIEELVGLARERDMRAVFTEPQLSAAAAQAVAEAAGLPVYMLDPLGGVAGRATYGEWLLYNAHQLAQAIGGNREANGGG